MAALMGPCDACAAGLHRQCEKRQSRMMLCACQLCWSPSIAKEKK